MYKSKYQNKCLRCQKEWNSHCPGNFCSNHCWYQKKNANRKASVNLEKSCAVCNTVFAAQKISTKYCSTQCNNHDWFKKHPEEHNFKEAKRRAAKLNATPKWLTEEHWDQIKYMYESCPEGYHVDHVVPLQGENVSGLHTPWNLQHLPARDNIIKGNRV